MITAYLWLWRAHVVVCLYFAWVVLTLNGFVFWLAATDIARVIREIRREFE